MQQRYRRYVPPRQRRQWRAAEAAARESGPRTMGGGGGGGDSCDDGDCWVPRRRACPADVTLLLVGKVGSGKSATANSILGRDAFVSEYSYGSVTATCQMGSTTIHDGSATRTVNVIDTPGLFNMEKKLQDSCEDIIKCMDMARDGIHAMLMVFSATSRFSHEDETTIEAIKKFFGGTIIDQLILVFTNGDRIEAENNWKKMLTDDNCPKYLQDVLKECKNRVVLFDNETNDKQKYDAQLKELLDLVDSIVSINCGKPFSNQMFARIKIAHEQKELHAKGSSTEQLSKFKKERPFDEYFAQVTRMVEEKLNETIEMMEKQLLEERTARQKAEEKVTEAMSKSQDQMRRLRLSLAKAQEESDKIREENNKYRESEKVRREKEEKTKEEIENLKDKLDTMEREPQNKKNNNSCIIM